MLSFLDTFLRTGKPSFITGQSYADHLESIYQYPSTKRYQRDIQYWMDNFSQIPQYSLFSDVINTPDYTSSELVTTVSPELFRKIESFCLKNELSITTFFCTVLGVYIRRELGYEKFNIGIPVLNRTTSAELNSIGLYMHILPLKINLISDEFIKNAKRVENDKMNLFRHQKMTQSEILSLLKDSSTPVSSLFDIIFDYQAFTESNTYEFYFQYSSSLSLPIEIHLFTLKQNFHQVKIRYRKNMFHQEYIHNLWNRVIAIIEHILIYPNTVIETIPQYIIPNREREELLFHLNNTDFKYDISDNETLCSLFEKTAQINKNKICLTVHYTSMTFDQFLFYTRALDKEIRNITGQKKSIIAVLTERSLEMYTGIYAVIRGGNAYLPISTDDPPERIQYLIKDSGAVLLLTQEKFITVTDAIPCIDLTEFLRTPYSDKEILPCLACPEDTAYVIYTSGSTGKPKGAKISHYSLINRILWMQDNYPLDDTSVILQKTPYTFDVSLWEIFWWGICGGSMVASNPGEHFLPAKILDTVWIHKVTHLHFVPSVFDLFLTYLETHINECYRFASVKHVFLSGETLSANLIQRFYALFSFQEIKLHNLYGPTECTVDVTSYDCSPEDTDPVPIGKPIYNTSIYILDENLQLVPKGNIGELCIGGRNVGQGYLNNPQLTAKKFVNNPFSNGSLYKTGDYARMREDGQILFCGRIDGQRKLNGQRLETSEIESLIQSIDGIEAIVVDIHPQSTQNVLAAYYCGNVTRKTISEVCKNALPAYMVPTLFFHLEKLPLTPSGKLNRLALAELSPHSSQILSQDLPENEEEAVICDAFRHTLNIEFVGRNSNFFTLGGTSLSMIALLSEDLFLGLTVVDFIKDPTPSGLAKQLHHISEHTINKVSCLRQGKSGGNILVLFPYAGGGPESFAELTRVADQIAPELALYYVEYPKCIDDCIHIADELENQFQESALYFYSHCAGSAAALQVLNILEKRHVNIVKHYIAGASIPPASPQKESLWKSVPDTIIKDILIKAGASFDALSEHHITDMLTKFRKDTDFFTEYFFKNSQKIYCPLSLIISKQDLFTENYAEALDIWSCYASSIAGIYYINSSSHYFQSKEAETLMHMILEIIDTTTSV